MGVRHPSDTHLTPVSVSALSTRLQLLLNAGANPCDLESSYHASDEGHEECLAIFERQVPPKKLAAECTRCLPTQLHWGHTRGIKWLLAHGQTRTTWIPTAESRPPSRSVEA